MDILRELRSLHAAIKAKAQTSQPCFAAVQSDLLLTTNNAAKNSKLDKPLQVFWCNIAELMVYAQRDVTQKNAEQIAAAKRILSYVHKQQLFQTNGALRTDLPQKDVKYCIKKIRETMTIEAGYLKDQRFITKIVKALLDCLALLSGVGIGLHYYRWQMDGELGFFSHMGKPYQPALRAANYLGDAVLPTQVLMAAARG